MSKVDFCSFWWAFRVDRFVSGPVHLLLWFVVPVLRWIRAVLPDGRIIATVVTGASLTPGGVAGARIAVLKPNAQADVSLHQIADQENIEIRNDTHLYLTAKMTDLSENGGGNLTGYAAPTIAGIYGPEILGPQSGPLLAYASTDKKFMQPAGRNARVWVMTPGYQESIVGLSEPEKELRKVLRVRTYCDQFIIPVIGLVVGLKAKEASELAKAISGALFTHHLKLVEDLGAFVREGDFTGFSRLLWRFTLREIETVGPLAKAAALVLGESLESLLTKRLGEDWVKRFVPFAGQVKEGIDWGARGLTMGKFLKTFDDLKGTPGKLEFFVYFEPGVSGLSPESLRYSGGGDTHPIWISGFGFGDEVLRDVRVRLMDEASQVIYVTDQVEKVAGGASLKIIVPDDALRNTLGRVRVSVWMRGKWKAVPEALTVVGRVGIDRIEPTSGYGGQSAVIYGKHIRPFRIANEVLFYRKKREGAPLKAVVRQITRREIHITIPEGVALGKEEEWEVVVIEKAGGHTRRSKTLAFTSKGERWVKVREKIRAGRMPEKSWVIQGRVDQKKRVARHNFTIPAGMELDLKLTDLTGSADNPDRVSLNEFKLWLQVRNDEGKLEWKNVHSAHHLERRNFRRRFVHATAGDLHLARYQLAVSLWYSEEANYKIELKTTARDDNGTGLDAPSDWKGALEFPVGEVVKGYLFGAPEKGGEDYADWWQVSNVPAGVEFRFELGNLKAFHRGYFKVAPQLGLVEIWRLTVDEAGRKTMKRLTDKYQFSQIESRDLPVIFRHREDQVCSYLVCVHHNLAYLQYWMKAELR